MHLKMSQAAKLYLIFQNSNNFYKETILKTKHARFSHILETHSHLLKSNALT